MPILSLIVGAALMAFMISVILSAYALATLPDDESDYE